MSSARCLVNGNPLLRFDGYYILMDTLEIPNLRQKSTEVLKRWFQKDLLGIGTPRRSVPAHSRSALVCVIHHRQHDLSLGGGVLDLLVRHEGARTVRLGSDRTDGRDHRFCGLGRPARDPNMEVLSNSWETLKSETIQFADVAGDRSGRYRGGLLHPAASPHRLCV